MKRGWIGGVATGAVVSVVALMVTEQINAQGGRTATGRVACVDVVRVFNEFQRQKDLSDEMNTLQQQLQQEDTTRRQQIDTKQAEIDRLDPNDPTFNSRTRELLAMTIDYRNWRDLKQADLTREVGVWSVRIYQEIRNAVEEIAERDGYDLVLYRGQFEPASWDPEVIKEQIRSVQVLYASPGADITQIVTDKLNTDYRAQPRTKMLNVNE